MAPTHMVPLSRRAARAPRARGLFQGAGTWLTQPALAEGLRAQACKRRRAQTTARVMYAALRCTQGTTGQTRGSAARRVRGRTLFPLAPASARKRPQWSGHGREQACTWHRDNPQVLRTHVVVRGVTAAASFHELALGPCPWAREALRRCESVVGVGIKAPGNLPLEGERAASRSERVILTRSVEIGCDIFPAVLCGHRVQTAGMRAATLTRQI